MAETEDTRRRRDDPPAKMSMLAHAAHEAMQQHRIVMAQLNERIEREARLSAQEQLAAACAIKAAQHETQLLQKRTVRRRRLQTAMRAQEAAWRHVRRELAKGPPSPMPRPCVASESAEDQDAVEEQPSAAAQLEQEPELVQEDSRRVGVVEEESPPLEGDEERLEERLEERDNNVFDEESEAMDVGYLTVGGEDDSQTQAELEEEAAQVEAAVKAEAEAAELEFTAEATQGGMPETQWNMEDLENARDVGRKLLMSPFTPGTTGSGGTPSPGPDYEPAPGAMSETQLAYWEWDFVNAVGIASSGDEKEDEPGELREEKPGKVDGGSELPEPGLMPEDSNDGELPAPTVPYTSDAKAAEINVLASHIAVDRSGSGRDEAPASPCLLGEASAHTTHPGASAIGEVADSECTSERDDEPEVVRLTSSNHSGVTAVPETQYPFDVEESQREGVPMDLDEEVVHGLQPDETETQGYDEIPEPHVEGPPPAPPAKSNRLGDSQFLGTDFASVTPQPQASPPEQASQPRQATTESLGEMYDSATQTQAKLPQPMVQHSPQASPSLRRQQAESPNRVPARRFEPQATFASEESEPIHSRNAKLGDSQFLGSEFEHMPSQYQRADTQADKPSLPAGGAVEAPRGQEHAVDMFGVAEMEKHAGSFLVGRGRVVTISEEKMVAAKRKMQSAEVPGDEKKEVTMPPPAPTIPGGGFARPTGQQRKPFKRPRPAPQSVKVNEEPVLHAQPASSTGWAAKAQAKLQANRAPPSLPSAVPQLAPRVAFGDAAVGGQPSPSVLKGWGFVGEVVQKKAPVSLYPDVQAVSLVSDVQVDNEGDWFEGLVFFVTRFGITKAKHEIAVRNVRRGGGKVVPALSHAPPLRTTHLVTNKSYRETLRELGIPEIPVGVTVVSLPWIESSSLKKKMVNDAPFLVRPEPTAAVPCSQPALSQAPRLSQSLSQGKTRTPSEVMLKQLRSPANGSSSSPSGSGGGYTKCAPPQRVVQPNGAIKVTLDQSHSSYVRLLVYNEKESRLLVRLSSGAQYYLTPMQKGQFEYLLSLDSSFSTVMSRWLNPKQAKPGDAAFKIQKAP